MSSLATRMIVLLLLWTMWGGGSAAHAGEQAMHSATRAPNVVLIMVDDLGWNGLGCTGNRFHETPSMDRLCAEGMRFTNAYASGPNCSPTRAAVLTGKEPARTRITNQIGKRPRTDLPLREAPAKRAIGATEVTLAEALRAGGYATAHIGKWNLEMGAFGPSQSGFDVVVGATAAGKAGSRFYPYGNGPPFQVPLAGKEGDELDDALTDAALAFIRAHAKQPFFLSLAFYAVHTPLEAKPDVVRKYEEKKRALGASGNATYAAMMETVDRNVGRVLAALDAMHLVRETLVILTSDNGPDAENASPAPLRGEKGTLYEGGLRVPLLMRLPGRVGAGVSSEEPVATIDLYPTIIDLAGLAPAQELDGQSLAPLLAKPQTSLGRAALYWHFPHYLPGRQAPAGATREGRYKLIESFGDDRLELYDLSADPGEQRNLASEQSERAASLRAKLAAWRSSVAAAMPSSKDPPRPATALRNSSP